MTVREWLECLLCGYETEVAESGNDLIPEEVYP